jgi:hypothetical protein
MIPRVLLVSVVGSKPPAVRALSLECERVIASFQGVTRVDLGDRDFPRWRQRIDRAAPALSGLMTTNPVREKDPFDLVIVQCMLSSDLGHCLPLAPILESAKQSALWVHEMWAKNVNTQHKGEQNWFNLFDRMYVGLDGTVDTLASAIDKPVRGLLHGVDAIKWQPPAPDPTRKIDLNWFGARVESTHKALVELTKKRDLVYLYDTVKRHQPHDVDEHREAFFDLAHRTKLCLVNPAKAAIPEHRGDQMGEIGYRYVEIAAAGGVMVGGEPSSPTWKRLFNWPGACTDIPVGSTDVEEPVMSLLEDPDRLHQISLRNRAESLRTMDIAYRWRDILDDFGFDHPPELTARIEKMNAMADELALPLDRDENTAHEPAAAEAETGP